MLTDTNITVLLGELHRDAVVIPCGAVNGCTEKELVNVGSHVEYSSGMNEV